MSRNYTSDPLTQYRNSVKAKLLLNHRIDRQPPKFQDMTQQLFCQRITPTKAARHIADSTKVPL